MHPRYGAGAAKGKTDPVADQDPAGLDRSLSQASASRSRTRRGHDHLRVRRGEVERDGQRRVERERRDPGDRRVRPVAGDDRDRRALGDGEHPPVPRRAERLQRVVQLVPGDPQPRSQPDRERGADRRAREQHALGGERAERHGGGAREPVRRRDRGEQRLVAQGDHADAGRPCGGRRLEHDRRGQLVRGDPAQQLRGQVLGEPHLAAAERLRQPPGRRPAQRAVTDREPGLRAGAARLGDGEVDLGDRAAGAREQRRARGRQLHPPRRAHEQHGAEIALELADRARERRLRHVQPRGGAAEVQLLGDRHEVAQLAELDRGVHAAILRRARR